MYEYRKHHHRKQRKLLRYRQPPMCQRCNDHNHLFQYLLHRTWLMHQLLQMLTLPIMQQLVLEVLARYLKQRLFGLDHH